MPTFCFSPWKSYTVWLPICVPSSSQEKKCTLPFLPADMQLIATALKSLRDAEAKEHFTKQAISIIAVQPLEQVIKIGESPDVTIRQLAVKALAEFSRDRAHPRVLEVLNVHAKDQETEIRRAAIYALARVKSPQVVKQLLAEHAKSRDAVVREQVAYAVANSDMPETNPAILKFLNDGDSRVLLQAVKAVRERKISEAFDTLKMLLGYRQPEVKREVCRSFVSLATPGDGQLFDIWNRLLYDQDAEVRLMAVNALEPYAKDPRAASGVGRAVTDQDDRVKIRALEILASSEDPSAGEQVIRGLFDRSSAVRMKALDAIESLASPKSRKAVQEFVKNEDDPKVKERAVAVLNGLL